MSGAPGCCLGFEVFRVRGLPPKKASGINLPVNARS